MYVSIQDSTGHVHHVRVYNNMRIPAKQQQQKTYSDVTSK